MRRLSPLSSREHEEVGGGGVSAASASFLLSRFSLSAAAVRSYVMRRALDPVALSFARALWTLAKLNVNGNADKRCTLLRNVAVDAREAERP